MRTILTVQSTSIYLITTTLTTLKTLLLQITNFLPSRTPPITGFSTAPPAPTVAPSTSARTNLHADATCLADPCSNSQSQPPSCPISKLPFLYCRQTGVTTRCKNILITMYRHQQRHYSTCFNPPSARLRVHHHPAHSPRPVSDAMGRNRS